MLKAMRRTELELDDDLFEVLETRARLEGSTVSELVTQAVRERYVAGTEERRAAMMGIVGLWKDRTDLPETEEYIRNLRRDTRRRRMGIE